MRHRILFFLKAESRYIAYLVILCSLFFVFNSRHHPQRPSVLNSAPYESFLKAEDKFQKQFNTPDDIKAFFSTRPVLAALVTVYAVFFMSLFAVGAGIDGLLIFYKKFRKQVFTPAVSGPVLWGAGALLHVIVHGMFLSLLLNVALDGILYLVPAWEETSVSLFHTLLMDAGVALLILKELQRHGASWKNLGFDFRNRGVWREIFFGVGGYAAVIPVFVGILILLMAIMQWLAYEPEPHPLVGIFLNEDKRAHWMIVFSIFLACVWGPFFEEVFFRGFCYPAFKKAFGPLGAGIMSASLFALIHRSEFAFVPILVLGLGLAFLYERRGNLTAPLFLHIIHNTVFITYFFLAKEVMLAGSR